MLWLRIWQREMNSPVGPFSLSKLRMSENLWILLQVLSLVQYISTYHYLSKAFIFTENSGIFHFLSHQRVQQKPAFPIAMFDQRLIKSSTHRSTFTHIHSTLIQHLLLLPWPSIYSRWSASSDKERNIYLTYFRAIAAPCSIAGLFKVLVRSASAN